MNLRDLNNKELGIILCILLFCDDTTLICDCPMKMQRLIDAQNTFLVYQGLLIHPTKS